jgi:hypothetical protein
MKNLHGYDLIWNQKKVRRMSNYPNLAIRTIKNFDLKFKSYTNLTYALLENNFSY